MRLDTAQQLIGQAAELRLLMDVGKRNARPFITMFGKRLYIDRFVCNNSKF